MVRSMQWQEEHPIFVKGPMDWTNEAYYTGLCRANQATQDDVFLEVLKQMVFRNEWKPRECFYHADDLAIALFMAPPVLTMYALQKNDKAYRDLMNQHFFENLFKTMAARLKDIQHEDGLWRTSLLTSGSYNHGEVSGSGFFTFCINMGHQ